MRLAETEPGIPVLALSSGLSPAARRRHAVEDIREGARLWRLAFTLAWLDIRLRYRGSMLGPFWLTLSTGVMVAALGVLYSTLFRTNLHDYLPFLALSMVLWTAISTLVSDACVCFTQVESTIRSVRMPFFVQAVRMVVRNAVVLAHNIVVIVAVYLIFLIWPGLRAVLAIPGLLLWVADGIAASLLLGAFCARFRDIQPIVNSVMQIAFFMTPVIWKPEQLGPGVSTLPFNPFYDLLEVVRGPILGTGITGAAWAGTIIYSVLLCSVSWAFFVRARGRVTFWI